MRLQLYLRGDVWWVRGSDDSVKVRKSTKQTNRSKAERIRERWERESLDPTHFRADKATVASAADRWVREITATMNPETVRFYDAKIRHVVRLLGKVKLSRLNHDRVLAFVGKREDEGAHSHSIHRELTSLRLTLKSAERAGEFPGDPRKVIPRYKAGYEPGTHWVTAETVWAAIAHLTGNQGAAVAFAIATAADTSSLWLAERADISAEYVLVRGTKTAGRLRHVPRVEVMAPFLRHAMAYALPEPSKLLFALCEKLPSYSRRACRAAGVPEFNIRDLRHSAATWMVTAGVPYEVVAKYLGHGSTTMLQRVYGNLAPAGAAHLINERMRSAIVPAVHPTTTPKPDTTSHGDS